MATGHILPGYGEPVKRVRRALSAGAYPLDISKLIELQKAFQLSQAEFDDIKQSAKSMWTITPQATTYNTYYSGGEIKEITQLRPTSSHRKNNPHPPEIFLTNRLHKIEIQDINPDTFKKRQEEINRLKYLNHQDITTLKPYTDPYGLKKILPPREVQAAESWLKLADDMDHDRVLDVVRNHSEVNKIHVRPKTAFPSLYRWMKLSGSKGNHFGFILYSCLVSYIENEDTHKVMQSLKSDPLRKYESCEYVPKVISQIRKKEIYSPRHKHYHLPRGDYSIHPGWPPSLPHHRVH